jgi:hypothetical protein
VATLKTYARTLWDVQQTVGRALGFDLRRSSLEVRALVISVDAALSLILKILVDKGLLSDIELNAAVQQVRNMSFTPLERQPPPLDPDHPDAMAFPISIQE